MPPGARAATRAAQRWRRQDPGLSNPATDVPADLCPHSVYLFGRLTNQSRTTSAIRQVEVALAANPVMIVRIDDESTSATMPSPPIASMTRQLSRRSVFE